MGKKRRIHQKTILVLASVFLCINLFSQNLVQNYSFETYKKLPVSLNKPKDVGLKYWVNPNKTSTDYFNSKSSRMSIRNVIGKQVAKTGLGYIGIVVSCDDDYGEFLQTKLKEKLIKDSISLVSH